MRVCPTVLAFAISALASAATVSAQTASKDVPAALVGKTITPAIDISYMGDSGSRNIENDEHSSSPIKTVVSPDGNVKVRIERGILRVDAQYPKSFSAGTAFNITDVKFDKKDIELILTPIPAGKDTGDVKLMLGDGYESKSTQELLAQINQMLKVGQAAPQGASSAASSAPVTLDCTPNQKMVDDRLMEVVFDEASLSASFQTVGKPKAMQPAKFTDAQIQWNNGSPGANREFYSLSRSTGVLAIKNTDTSMRVVTGNNRLDSAATMLFTCTVRSKKF